MKPVDHMNFAEIQSELRAYQPATAALVITTDHHKARRRQLWLRLDKLRSVKSGIIRFERQPAANWHAAGGISP